MARLISDHMLVVFFSYGLAFFLLGIAILLQPKRGSAFKIGNSLWLLASFGLLHGLNEWMDMFLTLGDTYWTPLGTEVIKVASFYFMAASFICLLHFGLITLQNRPKYEFIKLTASIPSLLFLVAVTSYGVSTGFSGQCLQLSQILGRYLLGFPWSGFNGHWVLAATEVVIHSRSQFPSCRSKPDGNGGRFCPLRVLCWSGRSQWSFFPSIST